MDEYMFREHVRESRSVHEDTSYLEIFTYSVSVPLAAGVGTTLLTRSLCRTPATTPWRSTR